MSEDMCGLRKWLPCQFSFCLAIERLSVPITDYSAVVLACFSMNFMLSTHTLTYEAGSFWIVFLLGFVK